MEITEAAMALIGERVRRSQMADPVVYLVQSTAGKKVPPPGLRGLMKKGLLDVAERGLVLKDQNGHILLPKRTPAGENTNSAL